MMQEAESPFVHATAVMVGECGVLIEGPSGSGKSALGAALIAEAVSRGCFGRLVGDDRVSLVAAHGRLVARPHPAVAGLLEQRGLGLLAVAHEPAGLIHLVVRLAVDAAERGDRLPDVPPTRLLCGLAVPFVVLSAGSGGWANARHVLAALAPRVARPISLLIPPRCTT